MAKMCDRSSLCPQVTNIQIPIGFRMYRRLSSVGFNGFSLTLTCTKFISARVTIGSSFQTCSLSKDSPGLRCRNGVLQRGTRCGMSMLREVRATPVVEGGRTGTHLTDLQYPQYPNDASWGKKNQPASRKLPWHIDVSVPIL